MVKPKRWRVCACGRRRDAKAERCQLCRREDRHERAERIERWWAEGLTLRQIAAKLEWTTNHAGVEVRKLREMGYDLPFRYTTGRRAGTLEL